MSKKRKKNILTIRQAEILNFIQDFFAEKGFPPTVRDIGSHFQMASSSSFSHLKALEKKGYLRREPHRSRSIEVLKRAA